MSYEKLGFVSGQTLKAEHLNHIEEGIANAGGVTSWNDLEDKPFGITETFVEKIRLENISTIIPTEGKCKATKMTMSGFTPSIGKKYKVTFAELDGNGNVIIYREEEFVAQNTSGVIQLGSNDDWFYVTCATGLVTYNIYFYPHIAASGSYTYVTVCIYDYEESFVHIDEKCLPESVEGVVIRSSTEGSTKKFKLAVDDSGTISATEVTA